MNDILDAIIRILVIAILAGFIIEGWRAGFTDDSDSPTGEKSGLRVRTDHKTGVQYLETEDGGITPRLLQDGTIAKIPAAKGKL
jgi:hypothetical protein